MADQELEKASQEERENLNQKLVESQEDMETWKDEETWDLKLEIWNMRT